MSDKYSNARYFKIGTGAFLRREIPRLALENSFENEFVLYADIDVMFLTDVADELKRFSPKYFAVTPEIFHFRLPCNESGVMLMNLKNLQAIDEKLRKYMVRKIKTLIDDDWEKIYIESE